MNLSLYCDNKVAINIAHNPVQDDRTKHFGIERHFMKEKHTDGQLCISFVKSEDN